VKMNGAVLVKLGHNEIFQPISPHAIVEPCAHGCDNARVIVAIDFRAIQGERRKNTQVRIAAAEITTGAQSPPPRFGDVVAITPRRVPPWGGGGGQINKRTFVLFGFTPQRPINRAIKGHHFIGVKHPFPINPVFYLAVIRPMHSSFT